MVDTDTAVLAEDVGPVGGARGPRVGDGTLLVARRGQSFTLSPLQRGVWGKVSLNSGASSNFFSLIQSSDFFR